MFDYSIPKTAGAMLRTLPFIMFRFLLYLAVAVGYILLTGIGGTIGFIINREGPGAFLGGLAGFGIGSAVFYWLREYILYLAKAGHLAVLVEHYDGRDLPGGKGQIDYAASVVKERFAQTSLLFGLDQLIKGILRALNRALLTIASILPIPGLDSLAGFANRILNMSLTYVDEIIIAYNFRMKTDNPWQTSRTALILYAQNYKTMVKNAVSLTVLMYILAFVIFLFILAPVLFLVSAFPGGLGFFGFIIAVLVAWCMKVAVLEPVAIYAMMDVFFKTVEGQEPNPEWEAKLESYSAKFKQLKDKAAGYRPGGSAGPAVPEPSAPAPSGN